MAYDEDKDVARRKRLIKAITAAFDGVWREDGVTLHQARVLDDYGDEEEQAAARKKDKDTRWQDVPDRWIERDLANTLPFLCPKSFRYYIPAFMIWSLKNYDRADSPASDYTIYALELTDEIRDMQLERFQMFNDEQSGAIARFLDYFARSLDIPEHAERALDRHWSRFL